MGYFYHKFESDPLDKLYELLEDVTPLPSDCGALCGGACCKGGGGDGMLLFPGERAFFDGRDDFMLLSDERYDCDAVVCSGSCDRSKRPLSCRIYPYFFYVSQSGSVTVENDLRAIGRCPLTEQEYQVNKQFLRRMRMCAKIVENDRELYGFVGRISALLTDFGPLA
ncbi:MAG: hypothetical protein IJK89_04910 [Clostridia bacterium]|nr:hypothetical protein [Clostridia bacterium]